MLGGKHAIDKRSIQGRETILLVASCQGHKDKLWLGGPHDCRVFDISKLQTFRLTLQVHCTRPLVSDDRHFDISRGRGRGIQLTLIAYFGTKFAERSSNIKTEKRGAREGKKQRACERSAVDHKLLTFNETLANPLPQHTCLLFGSSSRTKRYGAC